MVRNSASCTLPPSSHFSDQKSSTDILRNSQMIFSDVIFRNSQTLHQSLLSSQSSINLSHPAQDWAPIPFPSGSSCPVRTTFCCSRRPSHWLLPCHSASRHLRVCGRDTRYSASATTGATTTGFEQLTVLDAPCHSVSRHLQFCGRDTRYSASATTGDTTTGFEQLTVLDAVTLLVTVFHAIYNFVAETHDIPPQQLLATRPPASNSSPCSTP